MFFNFLIMGLLVVFSKSPAMDQQNDDVELSQVVVTTPLNQPTGVLPQPVNNNFCCRNKKKIACGFTTVAGCAFALTALYALGHPQQHCGELSNKPYLDKSDPIKVEGYSFDVEISHCDQCVSASMICNNPIAGVKDSNQLIQHVHATMQPICGNKAKYHIRPTVMQKSDLFGRGPEGFKNFNDSIKTVSANCKSSGSQRYKGKPRLFAKPHKYKNPFR